MDMGVQWTTIKWNVKGQGHAIYHNEVKCQRSRIFNELQYLDKKKSNQSTRTNEKTKRNLMKQWTEQRFSKGYYMAPDFLVNNEIFKYE